MNENISIIDLTDKFPQIKLREEAKALINKNNENNSMAETKPEVIKEETVQQWTELFKKELSAINERLDNLSKSGSAANLGAIKKYIEKIRKIQEDSLNWQSEIAKAVNEVATYADTLAEKSNKHYTLTKKIVETVDHNAKTLNATQDWTGEVAKVTNAIGETVDHNAEMLNGLNEWTTQVAKGVNALNEWGSEKAKAINDLHDWTGSIAKATNGMHEWTSSIAKNLNHSVNWAEDMFGRAISKEDAIKLMEYVDLTIESKSNPELKKKIDEMLRTHSITAKPLNETQLKGIAVLDTVKRVGNVKVDDLSSKNTGVEFDDKTKTIVSKLRNVKVGKEKIPVGDAKLQMNPDKAGASLPKEDDCCNDPKDLKTGLKKHQSLKVSKTEGPSGPTSKQVKDQNMKLHAKPGKKSGFANENLNKTKEIQARKSKIDEKLEQIIQNLEKEKKVDEQVKSEFPFTQLLSNEDRKKFAGLDSTDKQKVVSEVSKVPTTDSKVIKKLWESALAPEPNDEPLWLKLAPKGYREAFNKSSNELKENVTARAEFYTLNNQYQIDNFWETSGVIEKPVITLNESVLAKTPEESEQKFDSFVASVGEAMKRYSIN